MDRIARCQPARWTVTVLALLTVFALVLGVRPRVIAEESGLSQVQAGVCLLCDGGATAATVAPAADSVSLGLVVAAFVLPPAVALHLLAQVVPGGLGSDPPPAPPPRA